MPVVELLGESTLLFRFPEIHREVSCNIDFERTLRLPEQPKRRHPLPGAGLLPLRPVDTFANRLPDSVITRRGVVMPMWQADALWLGFWQWNGNPHYVFAIKVQQSGIDAVTALRPPMD